MDVGMDGAFEFKYNEALLMLMMHFILTDRTWQTYGYPGRNRSPLTIAAAFELGVTEFRKLVENTTRGLRTSLGSSNDTHLVEQWYFDYTILKAQGRGPDSIVRTTREKMHGYMYICCKSTEWKYSNVTKQYSTMQEHSNDDYSHHHG